jgi:copper homeostasis protein
MPRLVLEVIVQTVADAVEAAAGGADRLEVVRDVVRGGLTPMLGLVHEIRSATTLPLRVMVRERDSFVLEPGDLSRLRDAAASLASLPVDGLVMGFVRGAQPDLEALASALDQASGLQVTFHRAFDAVEDPLSAIDLLAGVPRVDRILTGAGERDAPVVRCERLHRYSSRAAGRLAIMAGGGIDERVLALFAKTGCVPEIHVGRGAREGHDPTAPVSAARVRRLRELAG